MMAVEVCTEALCVAASDELELTFVEDLLACTSALVVMAVLAGVEGRVTSYAAHQHAVPTY